MQEPLLDDDDKTKEVGDDEELSEDELYRQTHDTGIQLFDTGLSIDLRLPDWMTCSVNWSEKRVKRVVDAILLCCLFAFVIYASIAISKAHDSPLLQFSTETVSSVDSPGAILCVDPNDFDISVDVAAISNFTGELRYPCSVFLQEGVALCAYAPTVHRFTSIILQPLNCIVVPAQQISFKTPRDLIQITMVVKKVGAKYNNMYFGLFATNDDLPDAEIHLIVAGGRSSISFDIAEEVKLDKRKTRSLRLAAIASAAISPNMGMPARTINGTDYFLNTVYILPRVFEIQRSIETLEYDWYSMLAAGGGVVALLLAVRVFVSGNGEYREHGLLYKFLGGEELTRYDYTRFQTPQDEGEAQPAVPLESFQIKRRNQSTSGVS